MNRYLFLFWTALSCLTGIQYPLTAQVVGTQALMPLPQEITAGAGPFRIDDSFHLAVRGNAGDRLYAEASRFIRRLSQRTGYFLDHQGYVTRQDNDPAAPLLLEVDRPGELKLNEDESYRISVGPRQVKVHAATGLGAIHALETLMQLINADEQGYYFPGLEIRDQPRFAWRGLLLDVCRHFMPMDVVKRTLDGMCAVKLNVLHLHLSQDQAFRVESKVFPRLQEVASDGKYFTQDEIREIIRYAGQRGIRVVPEFGVPGHTTAIQTAYPELASIKRDYELERYFGVFDPTLDPTKEETYVFLDKLFTEMAGLFPDDYFHIGGDENTGNDWNNNPAIKAYMKEKGLKTFLDLQTEFNKRILPILEKNGKKMMGWDEILQPGVPHNIVIQSWRGTDALVEAAKKGYDALLSNGYYIDLIQPTDFHYLNDPIPAGASLTPEEAAHILGGEATMWAEHVTPETVDSRIWPRLAAIAERFWSRAEVRDVEDMYRRLEKVSLQLESLGMRHMVNREAMLRRLAGSYDTEALRTLVDVIEPLKIYERNQGDTMYTVFSPYTKLADVAIPDQKKARVFRQQVDQYLAAIRDQAGGSTARGLERFLTADLEKWKANHEKLLVTIRKSPVLKEAEGLSENLSIISATGLEALRYIRMGESPSRGWLEQALAKTEMAREQGGRCELQVVTAIEKLIKRAAEPNR